MSGTFEDFVASVGSFYTNPFDNNFGYEGKKDVNLTNFFSYGHPTKKIFARTKQITTDDKTETVWYFVDENGDRFSALDDAASVTWYGNTLVATFSSCDKCKCAGRMENFYFGGIYKEAKESK